MVLEHGAERSGSWQGGAVCEADDRVEALLSLLAADSALGLSQRLNVGRTPRWEGRKATEQCVGGLTLVGCLDRRVARLLRSVQGTTRA